MVSILKNLKQVPKFRNISEAAKVRPRNTSQLTNALKAYNEFMCQR